MFALDLFNTRFEQDLNEGAVDKLEARRIEDLNAKMDDLLARARTANPQMKAALKREFDKVKEERDSYYKIREGGIPGSVPTEKIPGKEDLLKGKGRSYYEAAQKKNSKEVTEDQRLNVGDPVVVTAPNNFEGKTGEIYDFSPSGSFIIVDLYNYGKHSMHLSDVEYNQYADDQAEEDDWYDDGAEDTLEGWSNKMVAQRTGQAPTPYSVYIKGKEWKSFPDDDHAENVANKLRAKFKAEGRDPSVITIAPTGYDKMTEGFGTGSKVQHPKYGAGQVYKVYPNGIITVNFPNYLDPIDKKPGVRPNFAPGDRDYQSLKPAIAEDTGSWIVYDPETKQIKKRFKTHTAGKSYAKTHGLEFASSEFYFDRVKDNKTVAETTLNPRDPRGDYAAKRKALLDLSLNKAVDQKAVQQRRLDLDREAKIKGVAEGSLNELSTEKLAQYKKAAGADATAADKRGNIERGNKRFKGIVNATIKQGNNDAKKHQNVAEAAMSNLHADLADVYNRMAPGIERNRDSFKAGQLYDALESVAEQHGAEAEFKRMMNGARNRAHMEYDTNPGGFQNWFWFLPFGGEVNEGLMKEPTNRKEYLDQRDKLLRMMAVDSNPANKQIIKQAIADLEARYSNLKNTVKEESTTGSEAVERAILHRIMVANTDLLMKFGPDKVMQAAEEVAYNVGDVDEIGSSDISAYVNQVKQILGVPEELDEKWSQKYKSSINCANPKGFSQKAHCAGKKK